MTIAVFFFRVWDAEKKAKVIARRRATREYIKGRNGEIVENSERYVDKQLLNVDGLVLLELTSAERDYLRQLDDQGDVATISAGSPPYRALFRLVTQQMLTRQATAPGEYEYQLTELGRLALRDLA
jgi:hypothetical protein